MDIVEATKGLWAVLGVLATGFVSWVSWYLKARHDQKIADEKRRAAEAELKEAEVKAEQAYRDAQLERTLQLDKKLDKVIQWQIEFAKEQNLRLKIISEGLDLSMEDDKLIFQAFRKSKLLNGDSEEQSKKLEDYRKSLMKTAYLFEDAEAELKELESLAK